MPARPWRCTRSWSQRIPQAHAYRLLSWVLSLQGRYREALTQAELADELSVQRALDLQT